MTTNGQAVEPSADRLLKKTMRREAKRQRKHEADTRRRLDAWERYRAMWDGIDLKRQMVEIGDKKARLALTIMGALNAAVFYVLVRGGSAETMPDGVRPWFIGLLVVYGIVTFAFVVQAIEALRPRPETRMRVIAEIRRQQEGDPSGNDPTPLGLFLPLSDTRLALAEELRLWDRASASHVCAELVAINQSVTGMLQRQIVALERVYRGLRVLVILAAAMLAMVGIVWSLHAAR